MPLDFLDGKNLVGDVACWFGLLLLDFSHKFLSRERAVPRMCRLSGRCMDAWWFTPDDQHQRISKVVRGSSDPDFSGLADHH